MEIHGTDFDGLLLVEPRVYGDTRGYFMETWNRSRYAAHGMRLAVEQDNLSWSTRGVLRGLHFQSPDPQAKLVYVLQGEIFDVAVDIRLGSPSFGKWFSSCLSSTNRRQIYIPEGFAHGFCVLSDSALVSYKCSTGYSPESEVAILWNDPQLAIKWPLADPTLSDKDRNAPRLEEIFLGRFPVWPAPQVAAAAAW